MKKIMFDNHYGLESAVLYGTKTMTRRIATKCNGEMKGIEKFISDVGNFETASKYIIRKFAKYKVGDVVAIAQRYSELSFDESFYNMLKAQCERLPQYELAGWDNKMFVKADLMPHQIQITDVKLERLQDITDEDCRKEGIQKLNFDLCDFKGVRYSYGGMTGDITRHLTPRDAFHELICKLSGKNIWIDNPYVFAYTFKLIK